MYKLIILIDNECNTNRLENYWPKFLRLAEAMPKLRREATILIEGRIYGTQGIQKIHELYFDTKENLNEAMNSPEGKAAGQMLQWITQGKMTLLFAHHQEDQLENIHRYQIDATDSRAEAHE